MKQVSFLHTADLHLDVPLSSLGDENKAKIRRDELEKCLNKLVDKVQEEKTDLLILSGDLFEHNYAKGSTILKVKNMFSELYNTEIIIVPGNHDPISDNSYYKAASWSSNVHILEDSRDTLYLEKYNTRIYCMGVKNRVQNDYSEILKSYRSEDCFNILAFHGTVDIPFEEGNYNPVTSKELFQLDMDYVALGHMHCYQEFRNDKTLIVNPGSPEPLGFDEEGQHGFVQGLLSMTQENRKRADISFIPSAVRQYHNIEVNINDCNDDAEVIERIDLQEHFILKSTDFYNITLTGFINKNYMPDLGNIMEKFKDRCFFIRLKNQTSIRFDYEQYLEDPGIKGEFIRRILDQQEAETSPERKETLFMAMQYGLQALENERID
ncbi:MAG: repair exonuclease [Eubacterium sp.]|nr:repair exonuclease [Eubacterium sp.]